MTRRPWLAYAIAATATLCVCVGYAWLVGWLQ